MAKEENAINKAIAGFNASRTVESVMVVLDTLGLSKVWIPCTAVMGQSDREQLGEMVEEAGDDPEAMVGKTFTANEEVRLIPDVLQNSEGYFFPVFSSCEEMGEYGERFSKVEKPFGEAMELARNNEREVAGIVVNAFTEPMVFPWEILRIIEGVNLEEKGDETI